MSRSQPVTSQLVDEAVEIAAQAERELVGAPRRAMRALTAKLTEIDVRRHIARSIEDGEIDLDDPEEAAAVRLLANRSAERRLGELRQLRKQLRETA